MGSSVSVVECVDRSPPTSAKELVNSFLCKNEMEKKFNKLCEYEDRMSKIFSHDERMRKLFVKYIKLGTWMEKFREGPENTLIMILLSKLQQNALNVRPFIPAEDGIAMQGSFSKSTTSSKSEVSISVKPPPLAFAGKLTSPTKSSSDSKTDLTESSRAHTHRSTSSMYRSSSSMVSNSGAPFFEESIREPVAPLELLSLLFASLYPLFLDSRMFKAHYPTKTMLDKVGGILTIKSVDSADYFSSSDGMDHEHKEGSGHALTLFLKAANSYDSDHLTQILSTPIWLERHRPSALIDNAPISISIASATQGRGFPLVYVNKAFERLTGYTSKEILGESCKILQGEETKEKHILRMNEALQAQRAMKIEVENYTKQGRAFNNLLILTPVFDNLEILSYVIGVQFDVTERDVTAKEIQITKDILAILPHLLNL